jgi:hypothetical protein
MSEEPSLPEVASDTVEIIILKSPLEVMSFIDELRRQHGIGNLNDGLTVLGFDLYSEALQEFGFIFRSRNLVNAEGNPVREVQIRVRVKTEHDAVLVRLLA